MQKNHLRITIFVEWEQYNIVLCEWSRVDQIYVIRVVVDEVFFNYLIYL